VVANKCLNETTLEGTLTGRLIYTLAFSVHCVYNSVLANYYNSNVQRKSF